MFLAWFGCVLFGMSPVGAAETAAPGVSQGAAPRSDLSELRATIERLNGAAHYPLPSLNDRQLAQLREGKTARIREVPEDRTQPQRVIGLVKTSRSKEALWLSLRDRHWTAAEELTEVLLEGESSWPRIWYQHLDAPRPFADRHYVLRIEDTVRLPLVTGGACWEHWWTLKEDGPELARAALADGRIPGWDLESTQGAVYVPVNDGAWLVCSLPGGGTLLGYHVRFVAGGRIPDRMIADYGMATLGRVLRKVVARAGEVEAHYRGGHYAIPDGAGQDIPLFGSVRDDPKSDDRPALSPPPAAARSSPPSPPRRPAPP
jgi:hypothetical protein